MFEYCWEGSDGVDREREALMVRPSLILHVRFLRSREERRPEHRKKWSFLGGGQSLGLVQIQGLLALW